MDQIEAEFRRVESLLDGLLKQAEEHLQCAGVRIEDHSARTYHYTNEYLYWYQTFMKEWPVDVEKARVTAGLHYGEPIKGGERPNLRLSWRAELFQQGQESSIDKRGETLRTLDDVEKDGLAATMLEAIAQGAAWLPAAS
jgi:hypothetical protein